MSRGTIFRLVLLSLITGAATAVIMLIPDWNGPQASAEADEIDTLLDVMIVISSFVFAVVCVALGYAVWKFKAKPGDESDGKPIHGNTKLEIAWTLIPTIIVLAAAIYSWVILDDIESEAATKLPIDVTAQQYKWTFEYPEQGKTADELHVPVGEQLELHLTALDVLHSFWVPEWRIKRDLVPIAEGNPTDVDNIVRVTPDVEGSYQLICTELCGYGHSTMRAHVVVESRQEYEAWLAEQDDVETQNDAEAAAVDESAG